MDIFHVKDLLDLGDSCNDDDDNLNEKINEFLKIQRTKSFVDKKQTRLGKFYKDTCFDFTSNEFSIKELNDIIAEAEENDYYTFKDWIIFLIYKKDMRKFNKNMNLSDIINMNDPIFICKINVGCLIEAYPYADELNIRHTTSLICKLIKKYNYR